MSKNWYIVQTFTSYEQKVERELNKLLAAGDIDSSILTSIKVPMEEIVETKDGKKKTRHNKLLPGYIMLEMDLPQLGWKETCNKVRHIQGVNGFVGVNPNERPRPITTEEAKRLLQQSGEIKGEKVVHIKQSFDVGEKVRVVAGPFENCSGTIEAIDVDKNRLRVNIEIFGRQTPVEVEIQQAEKI
jgi:transcriptional antiterminator NusG